MVVGQTALVDLVHQVVAYTMRSVGEYMKDQQQRKELVLMNYDL